MSTAARKTSRTVLVLGLCALVWCASPARSAASVSMGLTPASQSVTPGTDFDLFIDVTSAGSAFNGFDAVVSFDPAALTFVPLAPTTAQQGCLMTGACSASCGNTFHLFSAAGDSLSVSDVLLCNQTFLTGPGHLYKLRFHASNTIQITHVLVRHTNFYNAGLFVTPVQTADAVIGIGVTLGVAPTPPSEALNVRVQPSPSFGRVQFVSDAGSDAPTRITLLDLQGRVVRALEPARLGAGARATWDGLDARGVRVAAGVYQARIERGDQVQWTRVVLLQ